MKLNRGLFIAMAIALLTAAALPASAAPFTILPSAEQCTKAPATFGCCAVGTGVPQLSCFLELGLSVSQWILGITGSLALLFFVYGGFIFLTSRGSSSQVEKGKTILTQATIGIIIIFGAYLAISFLVGTVLKAKFTTEIPKEATPTQSQAQPISPGIDETKLPCTCTCSDSYQQSAKDQAECTFECDARTPLYKDFPVGKKVTVKSCEVKK